MAERMVDRELLLLLHESQGRHRVHFVLQVVAVLAALACISGHGGLL